MADKNFNPSRKELREAQRLAHEVEVDARTTQVLGQWYGMHRPAKNSEAAFALSQAIASRFGGVK